MREKCSLRLLVGLLALSTSGCLPLTIASAGYQVYQYKKTGEIFGIKPDEVQWPTTDADTASNAATSNQSPTNNASNSSSAQPKPYLTSPNDVE